MLMVHALRRAHVHRDAVEILATVVLGLVTVVLATVLAIAMPRPNAANMLLPAHRSVR